MGVRNGKNYVFYFVGIIIAAGTGFAVNYIGRTTTEGPVEDASLRGEIRVVQAKVEMIEDNQEEMKEGMEAMQQDIKEGNRVSNEILLKLVRLEKLERLQRGSTARADP